MRTRKQLESFAFFSTSVRIVTFLIHFYLRIGFNRRPNDLIVSPSLAIPRIVHTIRRSVNTAYVIY